MPTTVHRTCTLCEATCGLSFQVEGDRILSVRPDPHDPISKGYACPKGIAIREVHDDPDRVRTPLRRTSTRRLRADRMEGSARRSGRRHPPRAAAPRPPTRSRSTGATRSSTTTARCWCARVSTSALGTRNVYGAGSQDVSPRFAASYHLYGSSVAVPVPDVDRSDYFLCVGANPVVSNGSVMTAPDMRGRLRKLRERGGKLVVVDPRRSETAREADEHVAIRPGTDAALLLAMAAVTRARRSRGRRGDARRERLGSRRGATARTRSRRGRARHRHRDRAHRATRHRVRGAAVVGRVLAHRRLQFPVRNARHLRDGSAEPGRGPTRRAWRRDVPVARDRHHARHATEGHGRPRALAHARARLAGDLRRGAVGDARRGDRDAGRRADPRTHHLRGQSRALDPERQTARRRAAGSRVPGRDRPLRERDHAARRSDPAARLGARGGTRRSALPALLGAQRGALVAAGRRAARRRAARLGDPARSRQSDSAAVPQASGPSTRCCVARSDSATSGIPSAASI